MSLIYLPDLRLNASLTGPENGPPLVLIHALGLSQAIWQPLIDRLPRHRILSFDLRGHGASDCPPAPYRMGGLIQDTERLIDHFGLKETVVIGLSIGGMIAQGLAVKRLDLVRGLVLSNTAARIGIESQWQDRIALVQREGLAAIHDATMERWLGRSWRESPALPELSALFLATKPEGWAGCASAISGTDFYETTATLRLPVLAIAGSHDGSTPADLVRETADLIPGHQFRILQGAGHIPVAEKPDAYAAAISDFLTRIGHG